MNKNNCFFYYCIFYGILAVICLIGIKQLYIFFFIFLALCVLYAYLTYKHRNDKPHPIVQKIIDKRNEKKRAKGKTVNGTPKTHEQIKKKYKARLAEINEEFDFDYDKEEEQQENADNE